MKYYQKSVNETLKAVNSSLDGLTKQESVLRLDNDGKNELVEEKRPSIIKLFFNQFNNVLIYVLLIATILTFIAGDIIAGIIIVAVVLINAIVGVMQEEKANKAIEHLKKLTVPKVSVKRDGIITEIDAVDLVVGDLVILSAGDLVPADLRLVEVNNLQIEESSLTGESVAVTKTTAAINEENITIGDRTNIAYSSTYVTYGRGIGVVIKTGMDTEIGKIAKMISEHKAEETPLQKRLNELGKILGIIIVIISVLVFVIHILYQKPWVHGFDFKDAQNMFVIAVSLAVAAIPEGLAAIVAVVLALGTVNMSRKNAIVKTLPAVETLGSVDVICSDKTGTLTENKMTATVMYVNGSLNKLTNSKLTDYEILAVKGLALCNDANDEVGDPTEKAFIYLANKYNINQNDLNNLYPRLKEIPFDSKRKMMSTVHQKEDGFIVYTKGALDVLLNYTTHIVDNNDTKLLDNKLKDKIIKKAEDLSNKALRVLAIAYKETKKLPNTDEIEENLIMLGIVGLIDPPRIEVKDSIIKCHNAGIKVVMITGDHQLTAKAIAKELNIITSDSQVISGKELDLLSEEELTSNIDNYNVFARVSPEHKVRIVKAFQANGHTVSMTGDGINDAPALKVSDIGVAMGITGTDVTKSASDMVLTDDNFTTIVDAVEEGRNIYNNIKKSIFFLLTCNLGEIITILLAVIFNWPVPLLAIQILWVNLITDTLPAISLGMDLPTNDVMNEEPRKKDESLFAKKRGIKTLIVGIFVGLVSLSAFIIGIYSNGVSLKNINLITQNPDMFKYASSMAFIVLSLSQLILSYSMRNEEESIFKIKPFKNKHLNGAFIVGLLSIVILFAIPPLRNAFGLFVPSFIDVMYLVLLSFIPFLAYELIKFIIKKKTLTNHQ